jgi:hypothetical protein
MKIIPPERIRLSFNGQQINRPRLVTVVKAVLPTIGINDEGDLFKTTAKTEIAIFEPAEGCSGAIFPRDSVSKRVTMFSWWVSRTLFAIVPSRLFRSPALLFCSTIRLNK